MEDNLQEVLKEKSLRIRLCLYSETYLATALLSRPLRALVSCARFESYKPYSVA